LSAPGISGFGFERLQRRRAGRLGGLSRGGGAPGMAPGMAPGIAPGIAPGMAGGIPDSICGVAMGICMPIGGIPGICPSIIGRPGICPGASSRASARPCRSRACRRPRAALAARARRAPRSTTACRRVRRRPVLVRGLVQLAGHLHLALAGHLARHLPRVALHGLKLGPFIGALAVGVPRCRTSVERRLPHYGKNLTLTNSLPGLQFL